MYYVLLGIYCVNFYFEDKLDFDLVFKYFTQLYYAADFVRPRTALNDVKQKGRFRLRTSSSNVADDAQTATEDNPKGLSRKS